MNLIGMKVRHSVYGVGTVIIQDKNYVTIEFASKTTKFTYPGAFEKFIRVENSTVQEKIDKIIADAKAAALEHKREEAEAVRKAEEERKRKEEEERKRKATGTKGKSKNIDEMFSTDYHAAYLARQPILTYQQVEKEFGISIAGFGRGINPTDSTVVLISAINKTGGKFVYHDKWTSDGDYIYSGEGKTGDQSLTKGNYAIVNAARDGKTIHLFVKFSSTEYYYQGIFQLIDYVFKDDEDENGNLRKEYKFLLRRIQLGTQQ